MTHIAKAIKSNFQLIFSSIPETEVGDDRILKLNIFNTVIPSITLSDIEIPFNGKHTWIEGGITYSDWTVSYHVDDNFDNYMVLYTWLTYIYDGINVTGRVSTDYQVDAAIILTDNYNETVRDIQFHNIWPVSLGDVNLSYTEGSEKIENTATFKYEWFKVV